MKKTNDSQDDNVSSSGKIVSVLLAVTALYAALRIGFGISEMTKDNAGAYTDNSISQRTEIVESDTSTSQDTQLTTAIVTSAKQTTTKNNTMTDKKTSTTTVDTTTTTKRTTVTTTTAPAKEPEREMVIEKYKKVIDDRIDKMMNDGEVHICYALHDMDCDDIPELIMLYGESPGTQLIDIYSYSNGYIIPALKELSGKYMHFGKNKNKLVLIYGRLLDRVSLIFYEMDNQKNVKEIDSYNNLEYDSQDIESFNSILREYGVSLLSRSEVWTSSGEFHSALVNGETRNSYTFDGLSYELLENYDF